MLGTHRTGRMAAADRGSDPDPGKAVPVSEVTPMSKPYDVTTKDILKRDPPSWMAYLRLNPGGSLQVVDTDVSTVPAETDQVYRVLGRRAHLIHVEMQSRRDTRLARRLWRYNALLDLKYDLRVRSVAILLRPEADSRKLTGVLDLRLPAKTRSSPLATGSFALGSNPSSRS
jgi:hypothetical protein